MDKKKAAHTKHAAPESQTHSTLKAQVLEKLKRVERLTSGDAWTEIGCGRLAAIIHQFKRAGHQIGSRIITVPARGGRKARVAEYWMSPTHGNQGQG